MFEPTAELVLNLLSFMKTVLSANSILANPISAYQELRVKQMEGN